MTAALLVVSLFLIAQIFVNHLLRKELFSVLRFTKKTVDTFQALQALPTAQIVKTHQRLIAKDAKGFYQQVLQVRA
jgi:hypothetical protein